MADGPRRRLALDPGGRDDFIGTWLAALADTRDRTLRSVNGLDADALQWDGDGTQSVATNLYHLAAVEADWLYIDVMERQEFPPEIAKLFELDVRDSGGRLTPVSGQSLSSLAGRLSQVRERLVATLTAIPVEDFRRPRARPRAEATPEWIVHHLLQHEAEHRAAIGDAAARYRAQAMPGTPA